MKQILLTAFLIICSIFSFAQNTTQIEYNYMKSGYREVEEKGNDLKKGYVATELPANNAADLNLNFTLLKRNDSTIAGIIVKTVSTGAMGSGTNYYCIPAVSSTGKKSYGWAQFYGDINTMTNGQKVAILKWLAYKAQLEMAQ